VVSSDRKVQSGVLRQLARNCFIEIILGLTIFALVGGAWNDASGCSLHVIFGMKRSKKRTANGKQTTCVHVAHRTFTCAAVAATLFTAPARAEEVKAGDSFISQAWSRATRAGRKSPAAI